MQNVVKTFIASASELQSSDLYMTVKATLFTVPAANLNGVRCTMAFLDEIVEHQDKYIGLPLCADTVNLVKGRYTKLGHCYNPKTGTYSSSIIGSFYRFEKEELDDGEAALVGYARVMKRNHRVCKAIGELFADGALKFSFEISCGTYETLDDETILVDKADNNFLEGMCIVSFPACPDAVAKELVAEINGIGKEADEMIDVIESAEIVEEVSEAISIAAETEETESQEVIAESQETEAADVPAESIVAETENSEPVAEESNESVHAESEVQNAEVFVTTHTHTCETIEIYDADTQTSIVETETHEVHTHEAIPEATLVLEVVPDNAPASSVGETETSSCKKEEEERCAEVPNGIIAELQNTIAALQHEVSQLAAKLNERVVAEVKQPKLPAEEINPFMSEIAAPKKYSLLDSDKSYGNSYTLLDKA